MKIGIITFHWATNYGGVLQCYALQTHLSKTPGNEVSIINFAPVTPAQSLLKCFVTKQPKTILPKLQTYLKERNFIDFRKKNLNTTKRYFSLDELKADPPALDIYVTGSDQVWNPYIIDTYGLPYFLSFGTDAVKRVSYAVSFSTTKYPDKEMSIIKPYIERFNALSVRENTGVGILKDAGITKPVALMPDPTLLMTFADLNKLVENHPIKNNDFAFFYILQPDQLVIDQVFKHLKTTGIEVISNKKLKYSFMGIESWLGYIRDSKYVVTNSFHGVVFSILFKKKFVVIPVEGKLAGMNDRIYTLLDKFNLRSNLLENYDVNAIAKILNTEINWRAVEKVQDELRAVADEYLNKNVSN